MGTFMPVRHRMAEFSFLDSLSMESKFNESKYLVFIT
jgi:hypothetical protein